MKTRLTIPEPCAETWDAMTPTGGGQFCGHCQHTVTDFTDMTDGQLVRYIKKNGVACGRLRADQLNRPLTGTGRWFSVPKPWLGLFAAGAFGYLPAQAQTKPTEIPVVTLPHLIPETLREATAPQAEKDKPVADSTTYTIVRVVDYRRNSVQGASVSLGETGPVVHTNQGGYFVLTREQASQFSTLTLSSSGLQQMVVPVRSVAPGESVIVMEPAIIHLRSITFSVGRVMTTSNQREGLHQLGRPSKKE